MVQINFFDVFFGWVGESNYHLTPLQMIVQFEILEGNQVGFGCE